MKPFEIDSSTFTFAEHSVTKKGSNVLNASLNGVLSFSKLSILVQGLTKLKVQNKLTN